MDLSTGAKLYPSEQFSLARQSAMTTAGRSLKLRHQVAVVL
jgi:hypothetical protein